MALGSNNPFPKVILVEQGSTPANPSAGAQKLFIDSVDHHVKRVNSSGVVVDVEGAASALVLDDLVDVDVPSPTDGDVLTFQSASPSGWVAAAASTGSGDVVGPGSAVNDRIAVFDGTTGKLIKDGGQTISGITTGAGGLVLLEQHTASSSATLDFTTFISASYDDYIFRIVNIVPASNGVNLNVRVGTGGGPTYDSTSGHYAWRRQSFDASSGGAAGSDSSDLMTIAASVQNTSNYSVTGDWSVSNPGSANFKFFRGFTTNLFSGPDFLGTNVASAFSQTTAITAIRFFFSSGDIASGTIRVYGYAK